MAANKQQGSYLTLFWTGATALCAGLAYFAEGFGKLVLVLGLAARGHQLVRIPEDQADGRKNGGRGGERRDEAAWASRWRWADGSLPLPACTLPPVSAVG